MTPREAFARMAEGGELARFYRSFGMAFSSGLTMTAALDLFTTEANEPAVRERATVLRESIARGGTLGDGAKLKPFFELEEALLRLGEESGGLDAAMAGLAAFFEADHRLAISIKAKLTKPFITMVAGCFIPPLPLLVRYGTGAYLATALPLLAVGLLASGFLMWSLFSFIRGQPRYAVARMLWALAIAIEAGLPIQRAVRLSAAALGPCATSRRMLQVPASSWQGRPLSETLAAVCQLPPTARAMLQTMERTGNASNTLRWLAKNYEEGTLSV
jgi:type II secretory pathway component PulF